MRINPIVNKVLTFIRNNNLLEENDFCLLGISGGTDSVSLLDIFNNLHDIWEINIGIAHVNYNLRGDFSIEEENYVRQLSIYYNVPFYSISLNLTNILKNKKGSLEEIARNIRLNFFEETAQKNGYKKIVLAHNANDQAETVLMKLIRGSVSGLKGIETKRVISPGNSDIFLIRPLLCLSRNEIENYCKSQSLIVKNDLSNFDDDFTRNRIRKYLLPIILDENPKFLEIINQTSAVFSQEDKFIEKIAYGIFEDSLISSDNNKLVFSNKINNYDDFLQRRIINIAYKEITGKINGLSFKNLEAIKNCIHKGISKKLIELPNKILFTKNKDHLIFFKDEK